MNLYRITQIDYIAPQTLRFEFDDGEVATHDFHDEINHFPESPVIAALADAEMFRSAEIVRSGRAVEWANGYDLCADQCRRWIAKMPESIEFAEETLAA